MIGLENIGKVSLSAYQVSLQTNLTLPKNIYELNLELTIPTDKSLSFAPGCVIKCYTNPLNNYNNKSFIINGTLNAIGTAEEPIVFTSTIDPMFGGNGSDNWNGFLINSTGTLNLDYARVRYACRRISNQSAIEDYGNLSVTNSEIAYGVNSSASYGIYITTPAISPTIKYNSFTNLYYGVYNAIPSSIPVNAEYNYWGSNYGPNRTGGCKVNSGVLYSPYFGSQLIYQHKFGKAGVYGPSGSFGRSYTDLSVSNSLQSMALTRTYNSLDDREDTLFSRGWTFNFEGNISNNQSLIETDEEGLKKVDIQNEKVARASNGAVYAFIVNSNGTYTSKDAKGITLVKNSNGTYTLTTKDQTQYIYNTKGKMASIIDKYGNTITISYSNNKISTITDSTGNIFTFSYNPKNKIIKIKDESANREVNYEYEDEKLVRVIDPTGAITRYSYDNSGFLNEVKDHDNNLIESVLYNHSQGENKDKVSQTTDAFSNTTVYTYDNVNRIVTMVDSNNRMTKQWYDSSLNITKVQDPETGIKFTTYNLTEDVNKYGEIASVTDRNGNITSYLYDTNGNNTQITNPDNSIRILAYDSKNNLTSIKDENNKMTYFVYDATKVYLLKKAQPLNGTTVYDSTNDSLFAITQYAYYSESERVSFGYKVKGLLKTETDPEGGVTTYVYDSNGNYATKINALNKATSFTYNSIGWLIEEVSPEGYHTNYSYNKNGVHIKKVLDGGETYRTVYNKEGRVIKDILPNQYVPSNDNTSNDTYSGNCGTRKTYYANGKVMTETDAEGNVTSYTYDDYGNIETETKPDGAVYRYEYDNLNRITKKYFKEDAASTEVLLEEYTYIILANKQTKTTIKRYIDSANYVVEKSTYDYANRLVITENPDSTTTTTTYNPNGTVQITTDTNGKSTRYSYDGLNRLSEKWVPFELNGTDTYYTYTSYTYDKCGRKLEEKNGKTLVLLNNRPAQFIITSYKYYADGNLERMTTSAGAKTEYAYDNDGVLSREKKYYDTSSYYQTDYTNNYWGKPVNKEVHVRKGDIYGFSFSNDDDYILNTSYTYDDNGNFKTETNPNGITTTYQYDNLNRQTSISQPGINEYGNNTTITNSTEYDYAGNIISKTDANNNQTSFEYDGFGHQIKMIDAEDGVTYKNYDYLGRVTAIVSPMNYLDGHSLADMNRTENTYDSMGRVRTISQIYYDTRISQWKSYVSNAYKYDNNGNVVKELTALGYAAGTGITVDDKINSGYGTISTFNYANLKITVLDAVSSERSLAFTIKYAYDALGRKISEINANGNITNSHYDDSNNITSIGVQKDSGSSEQVIKAMTYDKLNNVLTITDGNGNTTTNIYNAIGKVRTVLYPYDSTISQYIVYTQYDKFGNQVYVFDNNNLEKLWTFDNQGRQLSSTEQKNDETETITVLAAYDKNGNKRFVTDGNGVVKENEYDSLNRLVSTTISVSGIEQTTSYTYDADNNLLITTDWLGNVSTNVYDPLNRVIAKKDANNVYIERLIYNINDVQVSSTDALNNVTSYTYDKNNRILTTVDSNNDITGKTYDNVGNIKTTFDGKNNTTQYDYDEFNRLVKVTDPESDETAFTYDLNGNLLTQTDGNGHVKTLEYNAINKLIRSIDHGGRTGTPGNYIYDPAKTVNYTYFKNGNVYTMTDRNGEVTTYIYDSHNRLLSKTVNSVSISYTYDNVGNQLTITDTTGTTNRTYDEFNRVLTKTVPVIGTTEYTYDITTGVPTGFVGEEYTDPASNTVLKVYDKVRRLYTVTDGSDVTNYTYYDNGSQQSVTYSNGAKEEYSYIEGKLVSGLINRRPDSSIMDQYAYTYDDAHNILTKYEMINGTTKGATNYTYDTLNRLLTVTEPSGRVTTYTYDDAGNRETETIVIGTDTTFKTYIYNSQNRLESIEEQLNSVVQNLYEYGCDNNGNQLTATRTPYVNGIPQTPVVEITNSYDDFNQLTQSVKGNITSIYTYNGEGLRIAKNVGNTVTRYLYEYSNVILETDDSGNKTAWNTYGINLIKREVGEDSYYYLYNGHADVTALMDTEIDIIDASYYYDAFGNILESTGSVSNNIKYAGYQYDEETGYYYLNARMYDPLTARFLQEDTYLGDKNDPLSLNLYAYGRSNPLIYIDPTGHFFYVGSQQCSSDLFSVRSKFLPNTERHIKKKFWEAFRIKTYWNSDDANKDVKKDFEMLQREADLFGTVKTQDFGENNTDPLKPLPRGKALALYHLAEDPVVYDENNLDRLAIEQFERLTGSYHANEYLTSKDISKLIDIFNANPLRSGNDYNWEHREACKAWLEILNGAIYGTIGCDSMKAWNSGYGASPGIMETDLADAEVANSNSGNRCDYGVNTEGGGNIPAQLVRGQEFEKNVLNELDLVKNKASIEGGSIPDSMTGRRITEIKDVKYIYNSTQFRNYLNTGMPIDLIVSPISKLSKPLYNAIIRSGGSILVRTGAGKYIPYIL